jgi:phosphoribosylformylglycinamidine synthase
MRILIRENIATAAHDLSDGGLLVALAEMAIASGIGAAFAPAPEDIPAHAFWFGEDQARYVATVHAGAVDTIVARAGIAGVPVRRIGTTGGDALAIQGEPPVSIEQLRARFEGWLPQYMAGTLVDP